MYHVFIVNRKSQCRKKIRKTECVRRIRVSPTPLSLRVHFSFSLVRFLLFGSPNYMLWWNPKNRIHIPLAIFGRDIWRWHTAGRQFTRSCMCAGVCRKIVKIVICKRNKNYATIKSSESLRSIWLIFALWVHSFFLLKFPLRFFSFRIHTLANNFTDTLELLSPN